MCTKDIVQLLVALREAVLMQPLRTTGLGRTVNDLGTTSSLQIC